MSEYASLYLDDSEVERHFAITSSKLRTAQRFGLVESRTERRGQRHVRVWRDTDVLRVWVAESLSEHLLIPFQASVAIQVFWRSEAPDESQAIESVVLQTDNFGDGGGRGIVPLVSIIDRNVVYTELQNVVRPLGRLIAGDDGRTTFVPDTSIGKPGEGFVSRCVFDGCRVLSDFSRRYRREFDLHA